MLPLLRLPLEPISELPNGGAWAWRAAQVGWAAAASRYLGADLSHPGGRATILKR